MVSFRFPCIIRFPFEQFFRVKFSVAFFLFVAHITRAHYIEMRWSWMCVNVSALMSVTGDYVLKVFSFPRVLNMSMYAFVCLCVWLCLSIRKGHLGWCCIDECRAILKYTANESNIRKILCMCCVVVHLDAESFPNLIRPIEIFATNLERWKKNWAPS